MDITQGFDIAAYSMAHAQASVLSEVGIALMKDSIDMQAAAVATSTQAMEQSVMPELGRNIDILV